MAEVGVCLLRVSPNTEVLGKNIIPELIISASYELTAAVVPSSRLISGCAQKELKGIFLSCEEVIYEVFMECYYSSVCL